MTYIEDIIIYAAGYAPHGYILHNLNSHDQKIIESMSTAILNGDALTEKQATLVLKLLEKGKPYLKESFPDIDNDLSNPKWKKPFRILTTNKSITIVQAPMGDKEVTFMKVEFPYEGDLVTLFRKRNSELNNLHKAAYNDSSKSWLFPYTEKNIAFLGDTLSPRGFTMDVDFKEYYDDTVIIRNQMENIIPMLTIENDQFKFVNMYSTVPVITTNNLTEALFLAKKYGVTTWSDDLTSRMTDEVNSTTLKILTTDKKSTIWFNSNEVEITEFKDLITYGGPIMIFIPGGSELELTKKWVDLALENGIPSEQLSVSFRVSGEDNSFFNQYVKDNRLNNLFDENTRIVFVSNKIKKPLIKSGIRFNTIINLGFENFMHFSMDAIVDSVPTVVYYGLKEPRITNRWQRQLEL